ncbi:MAG: hypothetical protein ACFE8O_06555 [Candidatus Hermodarchaeota archaeon]
MKCAVHTDLEAIAVCQSCGNALCSDCRITIAGIAYCQSCLDAGRIRRPAHIAAEPEDRMPTPLGNVTQTSRRNLLVGIVGMILIAIFIHTQWLFSISPYFSYGAFNLTIFIPRTVGAVLVAVGICLSAFAWFEFKYYFNFRWAFYFALFTLFTPWWGILAELLIYSGLVYVETPPYGYWEPGPLAPIFSNLVLVSSICLGILLLLWAIALLYVRKNSRSPKLTLGASILFIIQAHMILLTIPLIFSYILGASVYVLFAGYYFIPSAIIIEIGVILTGVFFYRLAASLKPY